MPMGAKTEGWRDRQAASGLGCVHLSSKDHTYHIYIDPGELLVVKWLGYGGIEQG